MHLIESLSSEMEEKQSTFNEFMKQNNDLILVYNSQLGQSQKRLEKRKQETVNAVQKLSDHFEQAENHVC